MVISVRSRGADARTHNLPLTGIYKVIFIIPFYHFYPAEVPTPNSEDPFL